VEKELDGFRFHLIIDQKYGSAIYSKLHSISYRFPIPLLFLSASRKFLNQKNLIQLNELDIIYCPTTYLNSTGKFKSVVSLHDTQEVSNPKNFSKSQLRYRRANLKYTLKYADLIQVSSEFIRQEIPKTKFPLIAKKLFVIPEGVDSGYFRSPESKPRNDDSINILVPANFHLHKNHMLILQALQLSSQGKRIRVSFIGEGATFEESRSFADSISSDKLELIFLGKVEDATLRAKYIDSHIVISASSYESSSLPLLEALSSGGVAIASDIPAHQEMAAQFPIILFEHLSAVSLALALDEVIKNFEVLFSESAIQARRDSILKCDWNQIASIYLEHFRELQSI
jgi:glycosyltransferase involved in cell wall biosynthesis